MTMKLTPLEREVLQRVADGIDPWLGKMFGVGGRTVSQALQRLKRKGAIVNAFRHSHSYALTDAGRNAVYGP